MGRLNPMLPFVNSTGDGRPTQEKIENINRNRDKLDMKRQDSDRNRRREIAMTCEVIH